MKKQGFTILELLIALSISSIVILGMLQGYRNVIKIIERSRNIMVLNRKVCLFFYQLERDLSASFIPILNKSIKPVNPEKKQDGKASKKKIKEEESEDDKYFICEILPDCEEKVKGKRRELFKYMNFITTNALRIYSEKRIMLVRVMYELVKDKEKSNREKNVYKLLRRETTELDNFKFKEEDSIVQRDKKTYIKTYLIADNIKNLFVEYISDKTQEKKKLNTFAKEDAEKERLFKWGETKETKNIVPEMVDVLITFWNETLEKESSFECLIPILSYPTKKSAKEEQSVDGSTSPGQLLQDKQKTNVSPIQGAPKLQPVGTV